MSVSRLEYRTLLLEGERYVKYKFQQVNDAGPQGKHKKNRRVDLCKSCVHILNTSLEDALPMARRGLAAR